MARLCVYCGSNAGADARHARDAAEFGRLLVARGWELVYGGGSVGLMGILADAVLAAGGVAVGVIPERLVEREVGHRGLSRLEVVPDMHVRKRRMAELADAFVALPGGLGTFEELFEVWTWKQLGYHAKPIGLLNRHGYYDRLIDFLDASVAEGFMRAEQLRYVTLERDPARLLDLLRDEARLSVGEPTDLSVV
jgi:uncharacterized protein (TIGR00730 family)